MRPFLLSAPCLYFLLPLLLFAFEIGGPGGPPSQQKASLRYSGLLHPTRSFGTAEEASISHQSLVASIPVYRTEEAVFSLTHRLQWLNAGPDQPQVPDLYDVQLGLNFNRALPGERSWSAALSWGSASDRPFQASNVNTLSSTLSYGFPTSETSTWLFLLNYQNNRPILNGLPLPGFAYTYKPSKSFRGTFGAPFAMIYWKFTDRWSLNLFALIPWVTKASIGYSIIGPVQAYLGADFSQVTFLEYGRQNEKERIYYDERKVMIGLKSPVSRAIFLEVETGHAFDRKFFRAESYEFHPPSEIPLGSSWFGRLSASAAF